MTVVLPIRFEEECINKAYGEAVENLYKVYCLELLTPKEVRRNDTDPLDNFSRGLNSAKQAMSDVLVLLKKGKVAMPTKTQSEVQAAINLHLLTAKQGIEGEILNHPGVADACATALQAGVNWLDILLQILPVVLQLMSGGTVDWSALIAAILALINPTPVPIPLDTCSPPPVPIPTPTPTPA